MADACRTLRRFIERQAPVSGLFVSRYDAKADLWTYLYRFSEGEEFDTDVRPPTPNNGAPHGRSVETPETILTRDVRQVTGDKPRLNLGLENDPPLPTMSVVVPMRAHGQLLGGVEIESTASGAFTPDHVATLQLAAQLTGFATEKALAIEGERHLRAQVEARATALERRGQDRVTAIATKNRELEAFSFTAAHDLRAPLRGILDLTEAVLEREGAHLAKRSAEDLAAVVISGQRMAQLVEDLLRFARTSQGEVTRELVDMSTMAREIFAKHAQADPSRHVDVEVQPDLFTQADPALLRILLDNLLGNAWKYTRKRDIAKIRMVARMDGGETIYSVHDNGAGFSPAHADRIFLAFERLLPNEFEGTGVGLATAQRIVHRHGGRIWGEGRPGEGATFSFTLRARPPQRREIPHSSGDS